MTDVSSLLSTALAGRYPVIRELGSGGMATVYLAEDPKHHRKVAVKVLRPELAAVLGADRFLREIEMAAGLTHPHILPLHDSGEAGGFLYYVMPLVEGESLRDRLETERQLPINEAVRITCEVASALDYAHRHGVVHRDIKPDNIMLQDGHAVVADFGIGKAMSGTDGVTLTATGVTVGTPAYMSPEQASGDEIDGRSDLYSLGCVLYEMLTGEPPFTGSSVQAVIAKRFVQTPADVTALRNSVPGSVSRAVAKSLARASVDRFPTGADFGRALEARGDDTARPEESIAVLPFNSLSTDPEDEFFADGITEEIINALAQLKKLRVAARTSCFAFKGKHEDLRAVGDRLGVTTVLEGTVRKSGSRLRVTAQLVNAADGYQIWSERYDRELTDVFAIQDEIAEAIVTKLRGAFEEQDVPSPRPGPANLEAYELFLKGRALQQRRGSSLLESITCFERAVELDPDLAEAQAWRADAYRLLAIYGIKPATEMMPRAREAAEHALDRDPGQVEALATLANVTASFDWDFAASVAISDRALAHDPHHVRALCERAITGSLATSRSADLERWLEDAGRATEIDPLNAWAAGINAFCLGFAGCHDEAVARARQAVAIDDQNFMAHWALLEALAMAGRYDEALAAAEPALLMSGRHPYALIGLAGVHWAMGDADATDAIYEELRGRSRTGYVGSACLAPAAAAAGRLEDARALAVKAVEEREVFLLYWKDIPEYAAFRNDPVCVEIMNKAGL